MSVSSIRSLIRRPSALRAVATFQQRLVGRSLGYCTDVGHKKAKIEANVTLKGLDGLELKGFFPLVQQHLDLVGLRLALGTKAKVPANCHAEVILEGFEDPEVKSLRPCVDQFKKTAHIDLDKEPDDFKNLTYPCVDQFKKTAHVDLDKEPDDFKNLTYKKLEESEHFLIWVSIMQSLICRPSTILSLATWFMPPVFGWSPSYLYHINYDHKKAKVVASITLEVLDVSEFKCQFPMVQQHLDYIGFSLALQKYVKSLPGRKGKVCANWHTEVTFDGFDNSELETLTAYVHQIKNDLVDAERS